MHEQLSHIVNAITFTNVHYLSTLTSERKLLFSNMNLNTMSMPV